jgi:general stress protein 26
MLPLRSVKDDRIISLKGGIIMSPTQLNYEELKQQVQQRLNKSRYGVLATAEGDFVTARQMMLVCDGLTVSFITTTTTRKYKQILVNPNVAVAIGNMQIEGVASVKGRTSDKENAGFLKAFEKIEPELYKNYRDMCLDPDTPWQVIEITPKRIALFNESQESYLDVLHIKVKTAIRYYAMEGFAPNY